AANAEALLADVEQARGRLVELEGTLAEAQSREETLNREVEWLRLQVKDLQEMPLPPGGEGEDAGGQQDAIGALQIECDVLRAQLRHAQEKAASKDALEQALRTAQEEAAHLRQELQEARTPPPVVEPPELEVLHGERARLQADLDEARTELVTRRTDSEA